MTPKMWILRSRQSAAAMPTAFLNTHREFIIATLGDEAEGLLDMVSAGELLPTPTMEVIREMMFKHVITTNAAAAMEKINNPRSRESTPKTWIATVFDMNGSIAISAGENPKPLSEGFEKNVDACGWLDRRLAAYPDTHGQIVFSPAPHLVVKVEREDAMFRLGAKTRKPFTKTMATRAPTKRNPWMKAEQTRNVRRIG